MTFFLCETDLSIGEVLTITGVGVGGGGLAGERTDLFHTSRYPPPGNNFPIRAVADVGFGVAAGSRNDTSPSYFVEPAMPVFLRLLGDSRIRRGVFGLHGEDAWTFAHWGFAGGLHIMQYSTVERERTGAFGFGGGGIFASFWKDMVAALEAERIRYSVDVDPVGWMLRLQDAEGHLDRDHWGKMISSGIRLGAIEGTMWLDSPSEAATQEFESFLAVSPLDFDGQTMTWSEANEKQVAGTFRRSRRGEPAFVNRIVAVCGLDRKVVWERTQPLATLSSLRLVDNPALTYERWRPES